MHNIGCYCCYWLLLNNVTVFVVTFQIRKQKLVHSYRAVWLTPSILSHIVPALDVVLFTLYFSNLLFHLYSFTKISVLLRTIDLFYSFDFQHECVRSSGDFKRWNYDMNQKNDEWVTFSRFSFLRSWHCTCWLTVTLYPAVVISNICAFATVTKVKMSAVEWPMFTLTALWNVVDEHKSVNYRFKLSGEENFILKKVNWCKSSTFHPWLD